jgi:AbiU2
MTHYTEQEMKQRYCDAMGAELGEVFHHLMQETAFLHLKWNEYERLFGASAEQIDLLNRAAPGFFWLVQDSWWDGLLLHISRLTDGRNDVLTVQRRPKLVKTAICNDVESRLAVLLKAVAFARDVRNRYIAHRNIDVALSRAARPLAAASRQSLRDAIRALDDLLHFVEHHFLGTEPTIYDHLDSPGGSTSLLDMVQRGLRDRDRQFSFIPYKSY